MHWHPKKSAQERTVAERLRRSSKFYRFLWEIREELFADGFERELIASYEPRGQQPCPPALLAMVMLLQRYDGLSDADAVDAAENDRRWQLVLGTLGHDQAPFGQGSLVRFRTRMVAHDLDKKLVQRTVELAKKKGSFGWKNLRVALDSSPLVGAGRVEDTWNLIGRAMAKVVHAVALALELDESVVIKQAGLTVLGADSIKAALDIDWDDTDAQCEALNRLLAEVSALEAWVAKRTKKPSGPRLQEALQLLRQVVEQDTEPDPPRGGRRIKQGVPRERIVSVSDPEMRHGRKSQTKLFNGYKRHIAVVDRLIVGTAIEPANIAEFEPTSRLLEAAEKHGRIDTLDIDRGYLSSPAVLKLHRKGTTIYCKPWKSRNFGRFTKDDFHLDLKRRLVTCPAGHRASMKPSGAAHFDPDTCGTCELKKQCTKAKRRTVTVHPAEELFLQLKSYQRSPRDRQQLRKRTVVEHRLARVGAIQGNRARYRGARNNELDLNRAAAVANLLELARKQAA